MKLLIKITFLLSLISAHTEAKVKYDTSKKLKPSYSNLKTKVDFSGSNVTGKYQQSGEGLSIVEDEKLLKDLVQPRKQFKDRLKTSRRWHR